tara:strand:- start:921 stop:1193 length:273 start_codon:yes stop_codon:yes gene_type:complete
MIHTFNIENEGHTVGCLLRRKLFEEGSKFSACVVKHPQDKNLVIYVDSETKNDAKECILSVISSVNNDIDKMILAIDSKMAHDEVLCQNM